MNAAARILSESVPSRSFILSVILKRSQLPLLMMVIAVLVTALTVIYITNATRGLNGAIQQKLTEREQLHVQWSQLLLERSTWIMQARIQNLAQGKLGMFVPDNKSLVVINE